MGSGTHYALATKLLDLLSFSRSVSFVVVHIFSARENSSPQYRNPHARSVEETPSLAKPKPSKRQLVQ